MGKISKAELSNGLKAEIEGKLKKDEFNEHLAENTEQLGEKLSKDGDTATGILKAYSNTSYTVAQMRNIILSPSNASVDAMQDGEIWIKYK